MTKVLKKEAFTNSIEQTINVGDPILIVTSGYSHNVNTYVGVYAGFHDYDKTQWSSKRVVAMKYTPRTKYRHNETGIEVDYWWDDKRVKEIPYPQYKDYYDYADYNNDHKKYLEGVARYKQALKDYTKARENIQAEYTAFQVPHWTRTTLQLNRIFSTVHAFSTEALSKLVLPSK